LRIEKISHAPSVGNKKGLVLLLGGPRSFKEKIWAVANCNIPHHDENYLL
jgi:hypothetical protein